MMNTEAGDGWVPLVVASFGGALLGAAAATMLWMRRSRKSTTVMRHIGKVKIYHTRTFRSARVAWMIAELGAQEDYELVLYNPYKASDEDRQWYTACVHPHGTVPALVEGGDGRTGSSRVMLESAAICMHLADRYGLLLPQPQLMHDYLDVATVDRFLSIIEKQLELEIAQQDSKRLDEAFAAADIFARRLERQLNKRSFICGSTLTAADVVVGYCVMWASVIKGGRIIYDYPNVKQYIARLKSRPQFAETMGTAREWINSEH